MRILLARTQGFCGGVARAVEIVERALAKYGTPLYVHHEIVHNNAIVKDFRDRGVIFVDDLAEVPDKSRIIFSAHGVSPKVIEDAKKKDLHAINATCPLVNKVHGEAIRFSKEGAHVVLIGHRGHQELIGTAGHVAPELLHIVETVEEIKDLDIPTDRKVGFITQTTLSVDETRDMIDALKARFPGLLGTNKDDICYATQNRQDAIKELADQCDGIVICGSKNSSNSNRLREKGEQLGVPSIIIDSADELNLNFLKDKENIGLSSGASVPRYLVDGIIDKIRTAHPDTEVLTFDDPEKKAVFPLPEI